MAGSTREARSCGSSDMSRQPSVGHKRLAKPEPISFHWEDSGSGRRNDLRNGKARIDRHAATRHV